MGISRLVGQLNIGPGEVGDSEVASDADVAASKLEHRYKCGTNFDLAIGGTPVAREEIVFVAQVACTLKIFEAMLNDTGTSTDVDFDLKVNGSSVLSSTVNITNSNSDREVVEGTISSTALSAGDVVSIELATTSTTGAQGPFAWVTIDESAA